MTSLRLAFPLAGFLSVACSGSTGPQGLQGPQGLSGPSVTVASVDPGLACSTGGTSITNGAVTTYVCNGRKGDAGDIQVSSGTRLTAVRTVYSGADGSKIAGSSYGLYDTVLGVPCAVSKTVDGTLRCIPVSHALAMPWGGYFADSACSTRVAYKVISPSWNYTGCTPSYATEVLTDLACPAGSVTFAYGGYRVYQLAAALGTDPALFTNKTGPCVAAQPPIAGYDWYSMGAEVDPSAFVQFTVE